VVAVAALLRTTAEPAGDSEPERRRAVVAVAALLRTTAEPAGESERERRRAVVARRGALKNPPTRRTADNEPEPETSVVAVVALSNHRRATHRQASLTKRDLASR
jgi:hypothetical protein